MRKGTKKGLIAAGIAVGVLLALVVGAGAFLTTTHTGLEFIAARALPANMHVKSVNGALTSPFTLRGVTIDTTSARVQVDRLTVDWSPGALLHGTLDINRLTLAGVNVWRHPSAAQPAAQGPPRLKPPLAINIDTLELDRAVVHGPSAAQPFVVQTARLAGRFTSQTLRVRHVEAHGPLFEVTGSAEVIPGGDYATTGDLRFALRPRGYAVAHGNAQLSGSLRNLQIELAVAAPYGARATVTADALATPVRLNARATLQGMALHAVHAAWPTIAIDATATAAGTTEDLQYQLRSTLDGTRTGTLKIALDGSYANRIAKLADLAVTRPGSALRLHGAGTVDTGGAVPRIALQLDWQSLRYPFTGKPTVTLPQGTATVRGTPQALAAQWQSAMGREGHFEGTATRNGERFAVKARWRKLRWPGGGGHVESPAGTLDFTGTLAAYRLQVDAQMSAPGQTHGHLIVRGTGDKNSIEISRLDLKALQGELSGHAQAHWRPALSGRIALSGRGINPGLLMNGWPGRLGLELEARGAREGGALIAHVGTLKVNGTLRGYPVAVNLQSDYRDGSLALKTLSLRSGPSRLSAHGRIGDTLDLAWRLSSPDLASLAPGAQGSLHGHGHLGGRRTQPRAIAVLDGSRLELARRGQHYRFKSLHLDADVDMRGAQRSHLELTLAGGTVGQLVVDSIELTGRGTPRKHRLALAAHTSRGDAALALSGNFHNRRWDFTLRTATLRYPGLAPWRLTDPGSGYIARQAFALSKTCWTGKAARACVHAQRRDATLSGAFELNGLRFAYFAPLLPNDIGVNGSVSAAGDFMRHGGAVPTVHLTARTSGGTLTSTVNSTQPVKVVGFEPSRLKLDLDRDGLRLDAGLKLEQQGGLFVTARIPGGDEPLLQRPLTANLRAAIRDIGFVSRFKPTTGSIGGRLSGTMHVRGSLAEPRLQGRIALDDGSAQLPAPGLILTDVQLTLAGLPDGGLALSGQARSGGGTLALDGRANLTAAARRADLDIRGNDFMALNNTLGKVFITPDLHLALRGQTMNLTGTVKVPKAHLTPREIPKSAVTVSEDQVIVHPGKQQQPASDFARRFNADIHLALGDDVHFKGFGLKSRIAGNLEILEKAGQPTEANGELDLIGGEYRAYGQGLVIEKGTLLFAGPVTRPGLDIRALRHPAEDITVGVAISGTLEQPKFDLFSEPPMTQAETLSWLVLGRPLENTSDQQGSALSRLAIGLGITQSNKLAKDLGEGLGLDTFTIKTGTGEAGAASNVNEAALVIGKYLSPRLYVSYGIGLFEPVNTVRLEYTLSSRWKLATESNKIASGGDLIYTLER